MKIDTQDLRYRLNDWWQGLKRRPEVIRRGVILGAGALILVIAVGFWAVRLWPRGGPGASASRTPGVAGVSAAMGVAEAIARWLKGEEGFENVVVTATSGRGPQGGRLLVMGDVPSEVHLTKLRERLGTVDDSIGVDWQVTVGGAPPAPSGG